jgi:hypothetical protein
MNRAVLTGTGWLAAMVLLLVGCESCEPGERDECTCSLGFFGARTCDYETGTWNDCVCGPCEMYVDWVCSCDGVQAFYEAIGTTCTDTYQPLLDTGDPAACETAIENFEASGGCDQFGEL